MQSVALDLGLFPDCMRLVTLHAALHTTLHAGVAQDDTVGPQLALVSRDLVVFAREISPLSKRCKHQRERETGCFHGAVLHRPAHVLRLVCVCV